MHRPLLLDLSLPLRPSHPLHLVDLLDQLHLSLPLHQLHRPLLLVLVGLSLPLRLVDLLDQLHLSLLSLPLRPDNLFHYQSRRHLYLLLRLMLHSHSNPNMPFLSLLLRQSLLVGPVGLSLQSHLLRQSLHLLLLDLVVLLDLSLPSRPSLLSHPGNLFHYQSRRHLYLLLRLTLHSHSNPNMPFLSLLVSPVDQLHPSLLSRQSLLVDLLDPSLLLRLYHPFLL